MSARRMSLHWLLVWYTIAVVGTTMGIVGAVVDVRGGDAPGTAFSITMAFVNAAFAYAGARYIVGSRRDGTP
jgi:hypothetical protein